MPRAGRPGPGVLAMRRGRPAAAPARGRRDRAARWRCGAARRAGRRGLPRRSRADRRQEVPARHRARRNDGDHAARRAPDARHRRRRLAGTWPCPLSAERAARLAGARAAAPAAHARRIDRRPAPGPCQRPDHGQQPAHQARAAHAGKVVTVIIEGTCYRAPYGWSSRLADHRLTEGYSRGQAPKE